MNIVAISGNVATDIELREAGQTVVTSFNLAVKDDYKKDTTHFVKVEAWSKTAELLNQYCGKGSKIGVSGSIKIDQFKDKEGNNRKDFKVNANRIDFHDSKGSNQSQGTNPQGGQKESTQPAAKIPEGNPFANGGASDTEELPF